MDCQSCIGEMRLTVCRMVEATVLYLIGDDRKNYAELEAEDVCEALGFASAATFSGTEVQLDTASNRKSALRSSNGDASL